MLSLNLAGVIPVQLLKALLKALTSEKPRTYAISAIGILGLVRYLAAVFLRASVTGIYNKIMTEAVRFIPRNVVTKLGMDMMKK